MARRWRRQHRPAAPFPLTDQALDRVIPTPLMARTTSLDCASWRPSTGSGAADAPDRTPHRGRAGGGGGGGGGEKKTARRGRGGGEIRERKGEKKGEVAG